MSCIVGSGARTAFMSHGPDPMQSAVVTTDENVRLCCIRYISQNSTLIPGTVKLRL